MITILYGADSYRRLLRRHELEAQFTKRHGALGVAYFDWSAESAAGGLRTFLENQSIFDPDRLAVVFDALYDPDKSLKQLLESAAPNSHLHLLFSEVKKPDKSFESLWKGKKTKAPIVLEEFDKPAPADWNRFVAVELKKRKLVGSGDAESLLRGSLEGDSWGLINVLEKIFLAGKSRVEVGDLLQEGVAPLDNFWATLNSLKNPVLRERLKTLSELAAKNEPAQKTFYILASQLNDKAPLLAALDRGLKSGKLDYDEALLALLTS